MHVSCETQLQVARKLHVSCKLHFGAAGVVAASQVAFVVVVGVVREIGVGAKVVGGWPKYSKEHS